MATIGIGAAKPVNNTPAPQTSATGNMLGELNSVIPGFSNLTAKAAGNINELISGLPDPSIARNAGAYYGVTSGMPGSDYVRNKGFGLYNTQANAQKQQGLTNLLGLLQGVSGTAIATPGQAIQNQQFGQSQSQQASQFGQSQAQQQSQFDQNLAFQKWLQAQQLGISRGQLGLSAANQGNDMISTYLNFLK